MLLLVGFAFLGGLVTILSPCILPILPIVLSSAQGGKGKPYGVVAGFVGSFTFFTLFLTAIVRALGIPADSMRVVSVVVIFGFGVSMLVPKFQVWVEQFFSRFAAKIPQKTNASGFGGGLLVGMSLGLIWTPCVGPILASVISLSFTGSVSGSAVLITLAYSLGTALPMLAILQGGRALLNRVPWLVQNGAKVQQAFGVLMILTALGLQFNVDRRFQTWVLETFPQYGVGLTALEDNRLVQEQLESVFGNESPVESGTKTLDQMLDSVPAQEILAPGPWFNSQPLSLAGLRGKVVLIDFWTFSCINCIRTLPYLKNWYEKYVDDGLVIVGIHTPEFAFEGVEANVERAIKQFEITYPVVMDNEFLTWRAYKNRYWPAKYLINKDGEVVYSHIGEGEYDETEERIQELLRETGVEVSERIDNPEYQITSKTPEIYFGSDRSEWQTRGLVYQQDGIKEYSFQAQLDENRFDLEGKWTVSDDYITGEEGSRFKQDFWASNVYVVAGKTDQTAKVRVWVDGQVQRFGDGDQGFDSEVLEVSSYGNYRLHTDVVPGRHVVEVEIIEGTLDVYTLTFG